MQVIILYRAMLLEQGQHHIMQRKRQHTYLIQLTFGKFDIIRN
jgi:hypothetical protein